MKNSLIFKFRNRIILVIALILLFTSCSDLPKADDRILLKDLPVSERGDQRRLPLDGAHNFRDLGGYRSTDGRTLRWGLIYRSDNLHDLSREDVKYLERLGIRQVVDFRGPEEIEDEGDKISSSMEYSILSINVAGSEIRNQISEAIKGKSTMDLSEYMIGMNRELALDYSHVYRRWINTLRDNNLPQVYHCTSGKDRAGFATAILLRILGIPEDIIMNDYLLSNRYLVEDTEKIIRMVRILTVFKSDGEMLRPILGVDPLFLNTAFDAIDSEWGSFNNYVSEELELSPSDVRDLKDLFLE